MNMAGDSPPDPANQFAQHDYGNAEKDDPRHRLPHQSVNQLVQLPMVHAHICSGFRANLPSLIPAFGFLPTTPTKVASTRKRSVSLNR